MGEYENVSTELGLAVGGNFTCRKSSKNLHPWTRADEKKLRLTKEQSAFLEDSYTAHSTLTLKQKHEVAERLGLRPQQVEVWFQNRRARTKIKQVKMDCEYLKKLCESLSEENQRLKREMIELERLMKPGPTP